MISVAADIGTRLAKGILALEANERIASAVSQMTAFGFPRTLDLGYGFDHPCECVTPVWQLRESSREN
jgi:hypothetical protein